VVRAQGDARVILAVPIAPAGWQQWFADVADETVCVAASEHIGAIGAWYADFTQLDDADVLACLAEADRRSQQSPPPAREPAVAAREEEVVVALPGVDLRGRLAVPDRARGVVLFAHGSGSSRLSPRNRFVARTLGEAGLATLLFDLLTDVEAADRTNVFDIDLLGGRLSAAVDWLRRQPGFATMPVGLFGASTGAAAALQAASRPGAEIGAVVSRGGRPDLTGVGLAAVRSPTLLVVGGLDREVLRLNRQAQDRMRCQVELVVIPGATHLFEEPGTLEAAAHAARGWFLTHLGSH
jgi:dienelactone hydrolase